jgi:hypothetical protein
MRDAVSGAFLAEKEKKSKSLGNEPARESRGFPLRLRQTNI